jgi:hypothetical protein
MLTLTYGYKKPQTNDKGSTFFPALEEDLQQLNDHDHSGVNSAPIPVAYLTKSTQSILAANWVSTSGGRYRQEVTLPSGFTYANTTMRFVINGGGTDGEMIIPSIEKGSAANKYYIYINDNTLAITALYV